MRLLSSSRGQSSSTTPNAHASSSKRHDSRKPQIIFHMPGFGNQYLPIPPIIDNDEANAEQGPTKKNLEGEVEVMMPDQGVKRCRRLKVGLKTILKLAMGDGRGWEEDIVAEKQCELGTLLYLRPGSNRFRFSLPLDPKMAPHDWHPHAKLHHILWAELEGDQPSAASASASSLLPRSFRLGSRSPSASRHHSPAVSPIASRSASPTRHTPLPLPDLAALSVVDIPRIPSYEQSEMEAHAAEEVPMLHGMYTGSRPIRVTYSATATGGVGALDDRLDGVAPGLGSYKINLRSPLWTVNAFLYARIRLNDIPPTITIYDLRLSIVQKVSITSPRDPTHTAVDSRRIFIVHQQGVRPTRDASSETPALWRGEVPGGKDEGEWLLEVKGRIPDDTELRPTTLEGVKTPIHVSHQVIIEITFAVFGEEADGTSQDMPGPGEPRRLRLARDVVIPSCKNIPSVIGLPSYDPTPSNLFTQPNTPCPLCGAVPIDRACTLTTCNLEATTHPRHDHPPKLVGTADGTCPVCSATVGDVDARWIICACAVSDEALEALGAGVGEGAGVAEPILRGGSARARAWSVSSTVWRETGDVEGEEEARHRKEEYEYEARGRERNRR